MLDISLSIVFATGCADFGARHGRYEPHLAECILLLDYFYLDKHSSTEGMYLQFVDRKQDGQLLE